MNWRRLLRGSPPVWRLRFQSARVYGSESSNPLVVSVSLHAHTPNDRDEWHPLDAHLSDVADEAADFAARFGKGEHAKSAAALARWAGLWHDLGKAWPEFQEYLLACDRAKREGRKSPSSPGSHAIWGAILARLCRKSLGDAWKDLALPIAAHHAGLKSPGSLEPQLMEAADEADLSPYHELARHLEAGAMQRFAVPEDPHRRELRTRMVLSALADADYLDTERHFNEKKAARREGFESLNVLAERLERAQRDFMGGLDDPNSEVNRIRREVYDACLAEATSSPGFFRLTVPTGGGKTRSGLAFALEHARANHLDRVIVAIPYTSIIDQTAAVYADILEVRNVLVHHSQTPEPPEQERERQDEKTTLHRLATENWDAPLVLTTTVQLFESLFTRYPGRARKLHRLARSVIVLDEAQALPLYVLLPTLDVLRALVDDYGASVVLCTATQPGFEQSDALPPIQGVPITEIVPQHPDHFEALERVRVEPRLGPVPLAQIADEIVEERGLDQVLIILNARRDAVALAEELRLRKAEGLLHLSTLLCGAHRRQVLRRVRQRLEAGLPVRLISTQVVEAGVDIDFPVVYRALGPLDRIVQAAGRCNRENDLGHRGGRLVVFEPEGGGFPRDNPYRSGTGLARDALRHREEPLSNEALDEYFGLLFSETGAGGELDKYGVQPARGALDFETTQEQYRLIPQDTVPVFVCRDWTEDDALSDAALTRLARWTESPDRYAWRRLGPFTVSVYRHQLREFEASPHLETLDELLHVWRGSYDNLLGLPLTLDDPADLAYEPLIF
ncbi:MAG: CRISPR-associated helicase Cas3' [Bacteroidota bacterium]